MGLLDTAILTGLILPRSRPGQWERDCAEMTSLALTAGIQIVDTVSQSRSNPHPGHYFGRGFVDELSHLLDALEASMVVIGGDLSPTQGSALEDRLGVQVLDRTQLILEIFAQRAQSSEGKLQVELASLRYMLPRLKGQGLSMSRLAGGIGTRGPGETKLEVDRRRLRDRIRDLERRIEDLSSHREQIRRGRGGLATATLVGYTNAGKSTLLNRLTGASVLVEDRLFATLDPKLGRLKLPSGTPCLVSDTVGFIRHLPHDLVAAFRATLEEVALSDVLVHVVDVSHEDADSRVGVVARILADLGAETVPVVTAFNKVDAASGKVPPRLWSAAESPVAISALTGAGMDDLAAAVDECLAGRRRTVRFTVPHSMGEVVSQIHHSGRVLMQEYVPEGVVIEAELDRIEAARLHRRLNGDE